MEKRNFLIGLIGALSIFAMLGLGACDAPPSTSGVAKLLEKKEAVSTEAQKMPLLVLQTLDGKPFTFDAQNTFLRTQMKWKEKEGHAQPLLVSFWATWCAPCVEELPDLQALHVSGDAHVVTISTDKDAQKISDFLEKHHINELPVLHDPLSRISSKSLGAVVLPTTYIVDASGHIRGVEKGKRAWNSMAMREKTRALTQTD